MIGVWLIVNGAAIIILLVCIVRCSRSPADRGFIPGFLLIIVTFAGITLDKLRIIPLEWSLAVRVFSVSIALVALVLVLRLWNARRSSGARPS